MRSLRLGDKLRPMLSNRPSLAAPRVLVLMATFNGAPWLREQLDSIVKQRGVEVSLVVSDDRSDDGTLQLISDWARANQADVRVLPPAPIKLRAAGNFLRLIREASFQDVDAIALADQDDIWQPDHLSRGLRLIREHGLGGYSCDVEAFWPDGRRTLLGKASPQRRYDHFFEPAGPGCTYVLHPDLAVALQQEVRREPPRFEGIGYHDWLIYAYARTHGHRWMIDATPGVAYRQHGANELGANVGALALPKRWRRLTSGWFRNQVLQIAALWPDSAAALLPRMHRMAIVDRLWLAARVRELRRRPRDQLAMATMLLLGVLR